MHIKNFKIIQKIFKIAHFELFQIFGLFLFHIPPIRLHSTSKVSEKTLKLISVSSKIIGDQKSCQKISSEKFFWSLLIFFPESKTILRNNYRSKTT